MQKNIIDKDGFFICNVFVDENNNILFTNIKLKDAQQLVELPTKSYLKPQWNGTEWLETATQEELNNVYPIAITKPTEDEILRAKILKDNASMQLQLAQQQKLNADLLLKIANLGGSTNV